jgi:hypothetical protein
MLASAACWVGCAACVLYAFTTKPRTVSWLALDLWFRLPPEGIKFRNIGAAFWMGAAALFGIGWLFLSA